MKRTKARQSAEQRMQWILSFHTLTPGKFHLPKSWRETFRTTLQMELFTFHLLLQLSLETHKSIGGFQNDCGIFSFSFQFSFSHTQWWGNERCEGTQTKCSLPSIAPKESRSSLARWCSNKQWDAKKYPNVLSLPLHWSRRQKSCIIVLCLPMVLHERKQKWE